MQQPASSRDQCQRVFGDHAFVKRLLDSESGPVRIGEVIGKRSADQFRASVSAHLADSIVHIGDDVLRIDGDQSVNRRFNQAPEIGLLLAQLLFEFLLFGDVARRGEDALQLSFAVIKGRRIVRDYCLTAILAPRRQLVVRHSPFAQHELDALICAFRVGEVLFEGRAYQLLASTTGESLHLLIDVADGAGQIGGHQCVDVGFDQRARVELRSLQLDLEFFLRCDIAS